MIDSVGHPVFWLMLAAIAAPLICELPLGVRVPAVVFEVLLGILIGPHLLGLVHFHGVVASMYALGMAMTLFMAGMELDLGRIRGRPALLASAGWLLSLLIALVPVALLHLIPGLDTPWMLVLALCTTGLGVLLPVFRDSGELDTPFGPLVMAVGVAGELAPIVGMSLLLSTRYSSWQEGGFLVAFLAVIALTIVVGLRARPPRLMAFLQRHLHAATQLPVRLALVFIGGLFLLAEAFGFESIFGAFAAGMILGQLTRGDAGRPFREKMEALAYGWFFPFFFVGTGIKFDLPALVASGTTVLLLPAFLALLLLVRGLPAFVLYRGALPAAQRAPLALASAVPSLSIVVVITDIGSRAQLLRPSVVEALVGASLLALLLFPTLSAALLARPRPWRGLRRKA